MAYIRHRAGSAIGDQPPDIRAFFGSAVVGGWRHTAVMTAETAEAAETAASDRPVWVESLGGPLIAVPVSALADWSGCTPAGIIVGESDTADDYDRVCAVEGLAGVIPVGRGGASALVLADEPATSTYLPERRTFVRWLGADSDGQLLAAAGKALADPLVRWDECGSWETDGPAVLMDSTASGAEVAGQDPGGSGNEEWANVPLPPGRWRVRFVHLNDREGDGPMVGLVQLLPSPR